ncbi:hypothetical protein CROQUDRAFT_86762 [Cronartium quercuum f. sp. fusiforme G11]|uniref:Uncharacterized protein n=1 Tax=Cronartium quercuum f. sp. fusiforme G11 TaxID=708437 RepID=A0A9P6NXI0_9BASI|nr:hypothetical protein CROQUDRAFT_86762 [Cronartium quercuum f. sp. fusiforme G11]
MQSTTSTHTIRSIHQFLNHQSPLPLITPSVSDPRLDDQSGISLHSALTILREKDLQSIALCHDQNHLHHHSFSIHHALYFTGTPSSTPTPTPTLDGHILLSLPLFALLPTLPQLPDLIHSSAPPRVDLTKPLIDSLPITSPRLRSCLLIKTVLLLFYFGFAGLPAYLLPLLAPIRP